MVAWSGKLNVVVVIVDGTCSEIWLARKVLKGGFQYQLLGYVQTVSFVTKEEFDVEPVSWRQPGVWRRGSDD